MADRYFDPETYDPERPCRACGRHQGECDGPPARCCEACDHWTALPLGEELGDTGACPFCGAWGTHYMTHICPGCTCHHTEVRIPGEPQIPAYLDAEQDPDCPRHGFERGAA